MKMEKDEYLLLKSLKKQADSMQSRLDQIEIKLNMLEHTVRSRNRFDPDKVNPHDSKAHKRTNKNFF